MCSNIKRSFSVNTSPCVYEEYEKPTGRLLGVVASRENCTVVLCRKLQTFILQATVDEKRSINTTSTHSDALSKIPTVSFE